jgi:hypothetical protein
MSLHRIFQTGALALATLFAMPIHADVTLRYKMEVKLNPSLPPQLTQQVTKQMETSLPGDSILQLKEGKGYSSSGMMRSIIDFAKQQMTMLDSEKQHYASFTTDQLADEMGKIFSGMPAEARASMAAMKFGFESKVTGRSATIQGIEAEEREMVMTVEGPAMPNMPPGPMMRMVIQFWTAKDSEVMRNPGIRELKGYNLWAYATMNPAASMEKMFKQIPGMGEGMTQMMKDMQSANSAVLRTHASMFMPGIAAMMKQMPAGQSPFGANFDADTPFMEMNQELAELSTAPVSDKVFQIPEGYKSVPASEIIRDTMMKNQPAAKK